MILALSLLFPTMLFSTVASAADFTSATDVLATFSTEPTVAQVHGMALEYSKTDPHYVDGWLRAAKSAAALPALTVQYKYWNAFDTDYGYYTPEEITDDSDSANPTDQAQAEDLAYGPFETTNGVDIDHRAEVKAVWQLSKLVMSSEEIRVISEVQDIVKLRDKVLEDVTRLYFERRRLQVDLLLGGGGELKKRVGDELRLAELTAQIDAYTGGRFSKALPTK